MPLLRFPRLQLYHPTILHSSSPESFWGAVLTMLKIAKGELCCSIGERDAIVYRILHIRIRLFPTPIPMTLSCLPSPLNFPSPPWHGWHRLITHAQRLPLPLIIPLLPLLLLPHLTPRAQLLKIRPLDRIRRTLPRKGR